MDGDIVRVDEDTGKVVIRASALGGCITAMAAVGLGYESRKGPAIQESRAKEGELHEGDIVTRMEKKGIAILDRQREVLLPITNNVTVVGHIDGIALPNFAQLVGDEDGDLTLLTDPGAVFDGKSQSKDQWDEFERRGWDSGYFPKYKWQFSVYMQALQLPGLLARKNRNDGRIEYQYIPEPFYTVSEIRARALEVYSWIVRGELPPSCVTKQFPCPVYYLHEDEVFEEVPDVDLAAWAEQYDRDKKAAKVLEERLKTTRNALRKALGLELTDTGEVSEKKGVTALGWRVSFYNQKNSPSTDWAKVITALGVTREEFDEQYKHQTSSERLRVTAPKGKGKDEATGEEGNGGL